MKNLEDIRDTGGLECLRDIPVGKQIDFFGIPLKACRSELNVKHGKLPCAGCYFLLHEIYESDYEQCACLKYCTSPHRSDHLSVFFALSDRKKNK